MQTIYIGINLSFYELQGFQFFLYKLFVQMRIPLYKNVSLFCFIAKLFLSIYFKILFIYVWFSHTILKILFKNITISMFLIILFSFAIRTLCDVTCTLDGSTRTCSGNGKLTQYSCNGFQCCASNVVIADGITSIGSGAFSSCSRLTSITLPSSVTSIG